MITQKEAAENLAHSINGQVAKLVRQMAEIATTSGRDSVPSSELRTIIMCAEIVAYVNDLSARVAKLERAARIAPPDASDDHDQDGG